MPAADNNNDSLPFSCFKLPRKSNSHQSNSNNDDSENNFFWIFESETATRDVKALIHTIEPELRRRAGNNNNPSSFLDHLKHVKEFNSLSDRQQQSTFDSSSRLFRRQSKRLHVADPSPDQQNVRPHKHRASQPQHATATAATAGGSCPPSSFDLFIQDLYPYLYKELVGNQQQQQQQQLAVPDFLSCVKKYIHANRQRSNKNVVANRQARHNQNREYKGDNNQQTTTILQRLLPIMESQLVILPSTAGGTGGRRRSRQHSFPASPGENEIERA